MNNSAGERNRRSLAGTNLYIDPRNGFYIWRRVHEITGKRLKRSTGTRLLKVALAKAQKFDEEHERELAGLARFEDYRKPLEPYIEPFTQSLDCTESRRTLLAKQLRRAFAHLNMERLSDLTNFVGLEKRLLRLEGDGKGQFRRRTLVRCFQNTLKQFSRFLASRMILPADPLAAWQTLKTEPSDRERKALPPTLMARALAASDCLDRICARQNPMRVVWTVLLVGAPRISALAALNLEDLDREGKRLKTKSCGNKLAGACALDPATMSELLAYVGKRTAGPLFLAPSGGRVERLRSLDQWRATVSLAAVDLAWPKDQARSLHMEWLVHLALLRNRVSVAMGGQRKGNRRPGKEKIGKREGLARLVADIAEAIRGGWQEHMRGVDQHCLRMTHRTWALASGVPEILIDRQLGHTSPAGEAALKAAWSAIGRQHYTDMGFLTLDATRSAEAVRKILDRALADFFQTAAQGESALLPPTRNGRLGVA